MKSPMANCLAYKKPSCWLPRRQNSSFCATCASVKERDELRAIIAAIPTLADETIYDYYIHTKHAFTPLTHSPLDTFLSAVYQKSLPLTRRILGDIRTSSLASTFFHRVRSHTRTSLCAVYAWMLRQGLFPDVVLPQRCLSCLSHTVRYSCRERQQLIRRMIIYQIELPQLVRATLTMLEGRQRVLEFQTALIERDYPARMLDSFAVICGGQEFLAEERARHPLAWQWSVQVRATLRQRMAPWKEELIAKSWHPSRMQHWCLDLIEQGMWKEDMVDFPEPPVLHGALAEWNIRWGE